MNKSKRLNQKNHLISNDIKAVNSAEDKFNNNWKANNSWADIKEDWVSLQVKQNRLQPEESFFYIQKSSNKA
jgi:glutathione synthase/RimK-type ligase-like ATP-grasp enzyme